jgi:hypothetical protein
MYQFRCVDLRLLPRHVVERRSEFSMRQHAGGLSRLAARGRDRFASSGNVLPMRTALGTIAGDHRAHVGGSRDVAKARWTRTGET